MKKHVSYVLFIFSIFLLVGCTDSIDSKDESGESEVTEKFYVIGEKVFQKGFTEYYYGGIIGDSIVLNQVYLAESDKSYTMPLHIDLGGLGSKEVKLSGIDDTIKITDVDRNKNQVKILVKQSE